MRPLNPRIYTHLVTLWLALSVGGIVLGIVVWQRLNQNLDASLRGASFRIALLDVSRTLFDAESAAFAYHAFGDAADAETFRAARDHFPEGFRELAGLTPARPEVQSDLEQLRALGSEHLRRLEQGVIAAGGAATHSQQAAGAVQHAREQSRRVRTVLSRLEQNPQTVLSTHSRAAQQELQRALSTTLAAGLFGLGAGVLAFYLSRVALRQEKQKRELSEHALRAERAAQDKSTFLANMSHEIRTPMNAILGFSELLMAELSPGGRTRQHARSICDAAQSLLQLINDILDLSKIEASMLELHPDPTDVRELSGFLQTVFGQQAARKNLKLDFRADNGVPASLLVDRSRLRQILVNLVGNAIKFTQKGSVSVQIAWEPTSTETGTLLFRIVDTGVGIPAEKQAQIFEPFVQVDTRRPFEQQGTGLGLSIVQRLVERMGGTVSVESEVGSGSAFTVRLPDIGISAREAPGSSVSGDHPIDFNELSPAEILVVDDNAVNRSLLASTFEGTHHRVRFATNGREAVESVRAARPHVVLMDIRMPEMDGQSALAEIRKIRGAEALPVIAVTASSLAEDDGRAAGSFAALLRKPFTRAMLYEAMHEFLPRVTQAVPEPRGDGASPPVRGKGSPARWMALIGHLRRLERNTWPAVRDSGAIPEVKHFARRLADLGTAHDCPALNLFSTELEKDADTYAVKRLDDRLGRFPGLVAEIEAVAREQAAASTQVTAE